MLAIVIEHPERAPGRRTFAHHEIEIGSAAECALVLDGDGIAPRHARLDAFGTVPGELVIRALGRKPTYVGGTRLRSARSIAPRTEIRIGDYVLVPSRMPAEAIADAPPVQLRGPQEQAFVDAIVSGDRDSRLVYADWLEERGDVLRAEYLRVQHGLFDANAEDPGIVARTDRLRELAATIGDLAWRSRVAMERVEGCAFEVSCPREWEAMTPTDREGVRHCGTCNKHVMYCATVEEARAHSARGTCVALDIKAPRWDGDLDPPFGIYRCEACGIDVGGRLAVCSRCGGNLRRAMTRGMVA